MRAHACAACPRPRTPRPRRRPPAAPCAASRRTARAPRRRGSARARRGRAAAPPLARTRPPHELAHGRTRAPCRSRPEGNGGAEGGGRGRRGWVGGRASVERVWRRPAPPPAPLSTKTHDTMSFHSTQCCTYILLHSNTSGRSKRTASRRRPAHACCERSRTPAPTRARAPGRWVGCVHGRTRTAARLAGWGLSQPLSVSARGPGLRCVSQAQQPVSGPRLRPAGCTPGYEHAQRSPPASTSQHRQRKKKQIRSISREDLHLWTSKRTRTFHRKGRGTPP